MFILLPIAWWAAVYGVAKSWTRLSDFTFTVHFYALEKEMATHSRVLAWRIPGAAEPGGLLSMGSHRVEHNWRDLAAAALGIHTEAGLCKQKDSDIQESEDSENLTHGDRIQSRGVRRTGVQSWEEDLGAPCDPVFVFITPHWLGCPVTTMVHAVAPT